MIAAILKRESRKEKRQKVIRVSARTHWTLVAKSLKRSMELLWRGILWKRAKTAQRMRGTKRISLTMISDKEDSEILEGKNQKRLQREKPGPFSSLPEPASECIAEMLGAKDLGNLLLSECGMLEERGGHWEGIVERVARWRVSQLSSEFGSGKSSSLQTAIELKMPDICAGSWDKVHRISGSAQVMEYTSVLGKKAAQMQHSLVVESKARFGWCKMLEASEAFSWCCKRRDWNPQVAIKSQSKNENQERRIFAVLYKAARAGHPAAQFQLAIAYMHGEGCTRSFEWSIFWLSQCAAYYPLAQFCLATAVTFPGDQNATPMRKVSTDCTFVYDLYKSAAEAGIASAQVNMGMIHYGEFPFPPDAIGSDAFSMIDECAAVCWWKLAAEQNQVEALLNLGHAYDRGEGVPQCSKRSLEYWKAAAKLGDCRAEFLLGVAYAEGKGTERNIQEAMKHFTKASLQTENESVAELARERIASYEGW